MIFRDRNDPKVGRFSAGIANEAINGSSHESASLLRPPFRVCDREAWSKVPESKVPFEQSWLGLVIGRLASGAEGWKVLCQENTGGSIESRRKSQNESKYSVSSCLMMVVREGTVIFLKALAMVSFCLFAIQWSTLGAHGEALKASGVVFAFPFHCSSVGRGGWCLDRWFEEGLNVVLVGEKSTCTAKTGKTITSEYSDDTRYGSDEPSKGTHVAVGKECSAGGDEEKSSQDFRLAVVAVDPVAVHLIPPKDDRFPVPKEIELKARRLAISSAPDLNIVDSQPVVLSVEDAVLLIFQVIIFEGDPEENGPAVLFITNDLFPLRESCPSSPFFFSVNGKLHLAFEESRCCWRCGERSFVVKDLSTGRPASVYEVPTDIN